MLFDVAPLSAEETDQAFPVANLMLPELSLAKWRAMARRSRILRVRNRQGYIGALCAFRISGRKLLVEHAIAVDMMESRALADALIAELEDLARGEGCVAIHARTSDPVLQRRLEAAGHAPKIVVSCKPLDCPAVAQCRPETCLEESAGVERAR